MNFILTFYLPVLFYLSILFYILAKEKRGRKNIMNQLNKTCLHCGGKLYIKHT